MAQPANKCQALRMRLTFPYPDKTPAAFAVDGIPAAVVAQIPVVVAQSPAAQVGMAQMVAEVVVVAETPAVAGVVVVMAAAEVVVVAAAEVAEAVGVAVVAEVQSFDPGSP